MAFAQLTYRESLRDIEACLRAQQAKLYHMGLRGGVARNTLAPSLYTILQVISVTTFEKIPLQQALNHTHPALAPDPSR
jgi:hypothetical protein